MKQAPSFTKIVQKIQRMTPDMGGVFNFSDLWNIIGLGSSDRTAKVITRLIHEEILFKVRRDIYATKDPNLWLLASRFKKNACISMDSVLAKNGLIGTLPTRSVSLIYPGNPQTRETSFGRLRYFKIKKDLLFGTQKILAGITVADNEKAYIDLLYYHLKGARFAINPVKDVDIWKLDRKKIKKYLRAYKNPKFVKFVEGLIHANA